MSILSALFGKNDYMCSEQYDVDHFDDAFGGDYIPYWKDCKNEVILGILESARSEWKRNYRSSFSKPFSFERDGRDVYAKSTSFLYASLLYCKETKALETKEELLCAWAEFIETHTLAEIYSCFEKHLHESNTTEIKRPYLELFCPTMKEKQLIPIKKYIKSLI